jgi:hypothetical protein
MTRWLALIFAMSVFLVIGVTATFWTERVRAYWIRQCDCHPDEFYWRLVGGRVRKPSYSIELQLIGIMCLGTLLSFPWGSLLQWL